MHDRIHVRELIPELNIKAKEELNEDISRISADIHLIKEWLEKQPHLRARREDQWILSFLRGCKFSLERTKQKFDFYYKARTLTPEMCSVNLKEEKFWSIFEGGFVLPLETLDLNGNRLAITSPGGFDPDKYTFADAVQVYCAILEVMLMEDDYAVVSGITYVCDLSSFSMGHFVQATPTTLKKLFTIGWDSLPMRLKAVYYVNSPPGFESLFFLVKSILPEKLRNRVHLYGKNYKELYKYVPRNNLPKELGGSTFSIEDVKSSWRTKLREYENWFEDGKKYGTDESKRPAKTRTSDHLFGVNGSFRQLNVD